MAILTYVVDWILPFLLVLSILVFVHELGHYYVARRAGVRVETFSIGFGPQLFGFDDRHGTRWKFSAIPLGGYVKMFGEVDWDVDENAPPMSPEDERRSFHHQPLGARAAIVAAGPIANFLFALVVLAGLFGIVGEPRPLAAMGEIQEDSAAAVAGFATGDRVIRIDGQDVRWFDDLRQTVRGRAGQQLTFEVMRGEVPLTLTATPRAGTSPDPADGGQTIGILGVKPDMSQIAYVRLGLFESVVAAVGRGFVLSTQIMGGLWEIITGQRTADELGGPIRIAQMSGQLAQDSIINLVLFMAALSINLGLINLLPIPMLDGGHLAFYAIEAARGRPLDKRIQEYSLRFGLIFVLLLMIFATWNDLLSLNVFSLFE